MIMAGKQMKVFIELSDGTMYDLDGMATSVQLNSSYNGVVEFEIHGISDGAIMSYNDIRQKRTASEWACTYCNRPNSRKDETCKSCGGVRSFLYG